MPGGHRGYFDKSRSRDIILGRGEEYGRLGRDNKTSYPQRDPKIRGKDDTNADPDQEQYGNGGGNYGGAGGFRGGNNGGMRDRADR